MLRRTLTLGPTALAVLIAPRRTGRSLARRGLPAAVVVHLAALTAAVAAAAGLGRALAPLLAEYATPITNLTDLLSANLPAVLTRRLNEAAGVAGAVVLFAVGELFYWSAAIVLLSGWMGANIPPRRQIRHGAVAAGFATMWLIPLAVAWTAAAVLLIRYPVFLGGAATFEAMAWPAAAVCLTVVPAVMTAMALRLAAGLGDAVAVGSGGGDDDKLCEICGYNLHATPFDSRCPECGRPAAESLSTIHRCSRWETGSAGFPQTAAAMLWNPSQAFRGLRMRSLPQAARRFCLTSAAVSAAGFGLLIAVATVAYMTPGGRGVFGGQALARALPAAVGWALFYAGIWFIATIIAAMLVTALLAGGSRRRGDRLGPRGAMKLACYLSATALGAAVVVGGSALAAFYARRHGWAGPIDDTARTLIATLIGVGLLIWGWLIGARACAACRYANS